MSQSNHFDRSLLKVRQLLKNIKHSVPDKYTDERISALVKQKELLKDLYNVYVQTTALQMVTIQHAKFQRDHLKRQVQRFSRNNVNDTGRKSMLQMIKEGQQIRQLLVAPLHNICLFRGVINQDSRSNKDYSHIYLYTKCETQTHLPAQFTELKTTQEV